MWPHSSARSERQKVSLEYMGENIGKSLSDKKIGMGKKEERGGGRCKIQREHLKLNRH